ncbi:MAG: hypothetical protein ACFFDC_02315 [Promethearchaeota archaeon]
MKKIGSYRTEFLSHQFVATVFLKENGLIIDIKGPNDHLGGVGIGVPYLRKNREESANYHCISFPAHRDGELGGRIAQIISKITRYYTVVIIGIHIQDITKAHLKELIRFFEEWSANLGRKIVTEISLHSNKPK